ncbi:hypothetical protein EI427_23740 [Flammeovirga pectinis]|uniref:Uncharacterized protein n=1 Tax=Flammeovirga pectinis TaxID=2494373 RepID=A0A3Q9FV21_9BACT|nr:hypothetical protein [Flammeovirga pectinis]AZQ65229.1 hypothetical protein EI427_23740 [Flammeovirga pectinis]
MINLTDKNIAKELHKKEMFNRDTKEDFDLSLLNKIFNIKHFLIYNFQNYDYQYNIGLLLTFPDLFIHLNTKDWIYIIEKNSQRERRNITDYRLLNEYGNFSDLIFLSRYLCIDSIDLVFREAINITVKDRLYIKAFFSKFEYLLSISESELESDLMDFYCISLNELLKYRDLLLENGFNKKKSQY